MSRKRILLLFVVLALVTAAAVGGWVVGSRVVSPAEAAARTAPPQPSPILVPVEERVLSSNIVTRGTARFGLPQPISIAPSPLKAKAGLITTLPLRNTQFAEGDVIFTASGRPVFVLQGGMPAYRDLGPGISGNDVLQLEQGLQRLGFDPGPIDGAYDEQTGAAVTDWYKSAGWEPFGPTTEQLATIRTLEQALDEAKKNKLAAARAAAAASLALEAARAKAAHAQKAAAAALAAKIAERNRATVTRENGALLTVEAARAKAEHASKAAAAELAARTADRDRLKEISEGGTPLAVEAARAKADLANTAAAAEIAAKISERALIVLDPRSTATARAAADAQLELARAAAFNTQLEGELAVQAAERDASLITSQYELAQAALIAAQLEGELAVQAAERASNLAASQSEVARAAVKAARLEGELSVQTALDAQKVAEFEAKLAVEKAAQLSTDLDVARRKVGVQVPIDEIVFIPVLPVRAEEVTARVGDAASGPVMSVSDNQLAIDSSLALDAAPLVKPGMPVAIDEPALGIETTGVVKRVASTPGTHGVDGYHIYFEVTVDEAPTPLEGFSLRLTIPIESTDGAVIAVPVSALSLAADGTSRVQVENNGSLQYVTVEPGLAADGFVEVTPVNGTVVPGQRVVVGFDDYKDMDLQ